MLGRLVFFTAGVAAGAIATWKLAVEPWYREWGVSTDDAVKALAGDDLVDSPNVVDTRAIEIAAPPAAVWPWLVQMGYGRAGWYSYDAVDMVGKSVDRIVPEWQSLAEGDIVPTQPGGGFRAAVVDPGRALVLYLDGAMVVEQMKAAQEARMEAASANVRATGQVMASGFPADFEASWAMVLEPVGDDHSRLVTRFRVRLGEGSPATRMAGPVMGFGVFAMMRKQMLGVRDRAERAYGAGQPAEGVAAPGSAASEVSATTPLPAEPVSAPA
jgi:hypothetical protein